MRAVLGRGARLTFWGKAAAAAALVALADFLFFDAGGAGAAVGGLALAWLVLAIAVHREVWRDRRALLVALAAAGFAAVLIDHPDLR